MKFRFIFYKIVRLNLSLIMLTMIHKLSASGLWVCPAGENNCLAIPSGWKNIIINGIGEQSFLNLWECNGYCACSYDSRYNGGDCSNCNTKATSSHRVPIPTILQSCDVSGAQFVCEEGYFYSEQKQGCSKCINHGDTLCGKGRYFERCQKSDALECLECKNPIPNETSQEYGSYSMIPSCVSSGSFNIIDGKASCALYMTPTWDEYSCSFDCKTNFINKETNPLLEPICEPCYEVCAKGEYCIGGSSTTCHKCEGALKPNTDWLQDRSIYDQPCRVDCIDGFYTSAYSNNCIPCLQNQKCWNQSEIFLGCAGSSAGRCQPKNVECVAGETYLYYQVFSLQAECRKCSVPILGISYITSNCTVTSNTKLNNCSNTSQVPGHFKTQNCSLTSDAVYQRCSNPSLMKGLKMNGTCGGQSDYSFTQCSYGKACDGSSNEYSCRWPMTADRGLCKCPYGSYLLGEECVAVECKQGQYPHALTGECVSCTLQPSNHSLTLYGVWGEEACACKNGYFIQKNASEGNSMIHCWACGDLACEEEIQYQSPCPGTLEEEPQCQCRLPPGTIADGNTRCQIVSCDDALSKTDTFEGILAASQRLWNGSFWTTVRDYSYNDYYGEFSDTMDDFNLLNDTNPFSSITSITKVDQNTVVYVLNHTSLWVTSKIQGIWTTGMIGNESFIIGRRKNDNNVLIDLMVCRDAIQGRFWLSFVMRTSYCENSDDQVDGESLYLCSNFELMRLQRIDDVLQDQTSTLCLEIPNTSLCIVNLWEIWENDNIGKGLASLRIYSITMDVSGAGTSYGKTLYLSTGQVDSSYATNVYSYSVYFRDDGDIHYREETIVKVFSGTPTDMIVSLVGMDNRVFLLSNGFFTMILGNNLLRFQRVFQFFYGIKLSRLHQGPRPWILIAIASKPNNLIYEIDTLNGFVLSKYASQDKLYILSDYGSLISLSRYNADEMITNYSPVTLRLDYLKDICPMDTMRYSQGECTLLPCLLIRDACGDNSVRIQGSTSCTCSPGYFLDVVSNKCQICSVNHFCVGDNEMMACPSYSNSAEGVSSITQCLCIKGYYNFKQNLCLPCPKGFWCYGQTMPPVKCTSGSNTENVGAESPLDCKCQVRTKGFDCQSCSSTEVCLLLAQNPRVSAIYLSGSGLTNADSILNHTCLNWGVSVVYSLPWTRDQQKEVGKKGKIWSWVIVSEPLPVNANDEYLMQNISSCMETNGFFVLKRYIYSELRFAQGVNYATPCELNWEWSGDITGPQCTCIAGYEKISKSSASWCSPCQIGSIRARKAGNRCIQCDDNNSHAPWLGMDHCICKEGYYMDHDTQKCLLQGMGFQQYDILSSPLLIIPMALTISLICFLCIWMVTFLS